MEPEEVLHQFLELCNTKSGFLQYYLASNAVLEWFGRTIRGGKKIYRYYRYDLCQQYEHHFQNAQRCDPIEIKPSHMQTRQTTITGGDNGCDAVPQRCIIEFTPVRSTSTPKLPPLTQRKEFLPISEDDLSDLGLSCIQNATTPPQTDAQLLQAGEPMRKRVKYHKAFTSEDSDQESLKVKCSKIETLDEFIVEAKDSKESDKSEKTDPDDIYSNLLYIESTGILRMLNKTKHRGISASGSDTCSETSNSIWDRETKIKISYRLRKDTKQVQFALIIYEHITRNATLRRNLLEEFQKADDKDHEELGKKHKPPTIKRKIPLKKTLRLF